MCDQNTLSEVFKKLMDKGIHSLDQLDSVTAVVEIVSAFKDVVKESPVEQFKFFCEQLGGTVETGNPSKDYTATINAMTDKGIKQVDVDVKSDNLRTYTILSITTLDKTGRTVAGYVSPYAVKNYDKEIQQCSHCNTYSHCTRQTQDKYTNIVWVCNSCLASSDNPTWKKLGDSQKCSSCHVTKCDNHPLANIINIKSGT